MRKWPSDQHDKDSEYFTKKNNKPESDLLVGIIRFNHGFNAFKSFLGINAQREASGL